MLSKPGVLSNKNINDIENNFVEGNTTWTLQKTFVKMLTAGCLNQAKRIVEKYDEVLYGPAPSTERKPNMTTLLCFRNLAGATWDLGDMTKEHKIAD